ADIAGILDHAVEPAIDIEYAAFALSAITAVGFTRGKAHAADIAQPSADGTLHRLGHRSVMHADGIVEIGLHERQQFGAMIFGERLVGAAVVYVEGGISAVLAAGAADERHRQQQHRHALR